MKLNVDGSSIGNLGHSGFGGLIRNSLGEWIVGFSGACGVTCNMNAELHATAYGLKLAWDKGFRAVVCESDSQTALQMVSERVTFSHPYAPLVEYICAFVNYNWDLSFLHSLREGNMCADWLAKYGSNMTQGVHFWETCPNALSTSLLADAVGIARLRI